MRTSRQGPPASRPPRRSMRLFEPLRARAGQWLEAHPRVARGLERTGCLGMSRRVLARGVAVGLFVALTPTFGFQTALMLAGCVAVRASFPAAFVVSWVSNPITVAPLYFAFNAVGDAVFGDPVRAALDLGGLLGEATQETILIALGSLLIAIPAAVAGYGLFLWSWRVLAWRRWRARHPQA